MSKSSLGISLLSLACLSATAGGQDFSHQHIQRGLSSGTSRYHSTSVALDAYPSDYLDQEQDQTPATEAEDGSTAGLWIAASFAVLLLSGAALTFTGWRQRRSPKGHLLRVSDGQRTF